MARRTGLSAAVILFAGILLFAAYEWFIGPRIARRSLPMLQSEISQIPIPSSDRVIQNFTQYKTGSALVGETLSSPNSWEVTRKFYESELPRHGRTLVSAKSSRFSLFKKGKLAFEVVKNPENPSDASNYGFDVSVGLHD
jgi:hypothetical protein